MTYTIQGSQFDDPNIGYLIHLLNQYKDKLLSEYLEPLAITPQQFKTIKALKIRGPVSCSTLSQLLATDQGAMTRLLDRLEKKELLHRIRDVDDRRRVTIELTPKGHQICADLPDLLTQTENTLCAGLTSTQRTELKTLILRILEHGKIVIPDAI